MTTTPLLCGNTPGGGDSTCEKTAQGRARDVVRDGPIAGESSISNSPKQYLPYNRLTIDAQGQGCLTTGYTEKGVVPSDMLADGGPHDAGQSGFNNLFANYAPCPDQPRAPGEAAPVETRAMVAARLWEVISLPRPRPSIAPGRAITGKPAYLETKGATTFSYAVQTVFGALHFTAIGSYMVSWGDGVQGGPFSVEGRPWPDGQITHEYLVVGQYSVVVTERWTATWSLGAESGVLRTLQTSGRIENFPVEQIQAVIG